MDYVTGGKLWWLDYLRKEQFDVRDTDWFGFLEITSKMPPFFSTTFSGAETQLKYELLRTGLFPNGFAREERVSLGNYYKKIDVLATIDEVEWVIECKIPSTSYAALDIRQVGQAIRQVGQAIGQVLILTYLDKIHFKENLRRKLVPAICTWTIGSGSAVIKDICRSIGVTIIEIVEQSLPKDDLPFSPRNNRDIRIYYLDEKSPRTFCEDWS